MSPNRFPRAVALVAGPDAAAGAVSKSSNFLRSPRARWVVMGVAGADCLLGESDPAFSVCIKLALSSMAYGHGAQTSLSAKHGSAMAFGPVMLFYRAPGPARSLNLPNSRHAKEPVRECIVPVENVKSDKIGRYNI